MAYEFRFPDVGEGIHEGTIVKWKVKVGDTVKEDQALGDIETAKAIVEIPSPKAGVILKLGAEEGGMIKVGDVLAVIGVKNEKYGLAVANEPEIGHGKGVGVVGDLPEAPPDSPSEAPEGRSATTSADNINILPFVRKLAEELKVDLTKIQGAGPGGRITEDDVRNEAASSSKTQGKKSAAALPTALPAAIPAMKKTRKYDMWGYVDHVPFRGIRKTIAQHMVKSQFTAPHVTHFDQCDVTSLVKHRDKEKTRLEKQGIKLTYLPFIIKAVLRGLQEFPLLNASLDSANEDIVVKKYYNFGIAVDTPDGLMVPVLKGADKKSIIQIAKELQELAEKARSRKIDLMDLQGGSFTITSIGSLGGTFFTPVINYPEVAILGVASIRDMPWAIKGKTVIRKILNLGVAFDHRVIDGAMAAKFLNKVMEYLRDPNLFLLEYKADGRA